MAKLIAWGSLVVLTLWWNVGSPAYATEPPIQQPEVSVQPRLGGAEVVYQVSDGISRITWTVFKTKLNEGIIKQESQAAEPLAAQLPLISALLRKVLEDKSVAANFHTLGVGNLDSIDGMSEKLALAAHQSPDWNSAKGQPRTSLLNNFVLNLLKTDHFYDQLQKVFQTFHRTVTVVGVEQVQVSKAGDLSFFDRLRRAGIRKSDRVPYNGVVSLSITSSP
jgi:hypothetical protein